MSANQEFIDFVKEVKSFAEDRLDTDFVGFGLFIVRQDDEGNIGAVGTLAANGPATALLLSQQVMQEQAALTAATIDTFVNTMDAIKSEQTEDDDNAGQQ